MIRIIQSGLFRRYHVYRNNDWLATFREYRHAALFVEKTEKSDINATLQAAVVQERAVRAAVEAANAASVASEKARRRAEKLW